MAEQGRPAVLGRPKLKSFKPYDFEGANIEYASELQFSEEGILRGARSRTAIITCLDSRSTPEHFFELKENEAFVLRNGGGRATDPGVIRALTVTQALSELKEVKVVHHSNCGSLYYTDEWVGEIISSTDLLTAGGPYKDGASSWAATIPTLPFNRTVKGESERDIVERSVRDDVEFLRSHPLIKPTVLITGWFYNMHTGLVEEVQC